MEGIIKWREELRSRALELARQVADRVHGTVFLVGSYARGDFAEDSDIDVVVIGDFNEPPHRRLLDLDTPPNVEVLAFNVNEVFKIVDRCYPLALDIALGIVLRDDLGISSELVVRARRCVR
ncbi:nucleotidyltransferase domain-containing protein [Vulcanisaeta distributa]|uniref:DNA polymerase beta domain protein region n=1 Tax=Vulcanisaeta distributa (strain DSM 14429 / JCM 11212 / NBRC 100878 / IC-017) TaxID=572478 RepID=E1QS09_VULDI|nr:nucleotidyltransferase domain-containing protein [Vulcanisaeta distributa]ADN50726.1 DNA polymerase beta domain protein region [Vulcanisaeta distributa DSM 14429]